MCGRYIQVQKIEFLEKRFNAQASSNLEYSPSYNIGPGKKALVITNDKPHELQSFYFGLTPFWAKKRMSLINARSEGDANKNDDPTYKGAKGIINKPAFRKPIRSQRCLVIADAFIEGTIKEKLSKPYLVYLQEKQRPFAFAGIWDVWDNVQTGEQISSFAIITTVANSFMQKIPHHRSPVILTRSQEKNWIDNSRPLADITAMLEPFPGELMNAYPISTEIKNVTNDSADLIKPVGERLVPEHSTRVNTELKLQGMGANKNPDKRK